ncbi:LamG-like jellyroll fold domain-containing protein, partial [Thermoflexus sp.]|uniref:LamG-like jellyroll fold domain-containing protein n=1 Tax=Thermoflexus sp. TaxID=1969742 RepID=UPI002ADE49FD
RAVGYPRTFNGVIDEVEIFNRALTQGEIQSIYNAGPAGKCKLIPTPTPTATKTSTPSPSGTATAVSSPTSTPVSGAFDLTVSKSASCSGIYTCGFTLTVTNLGPGVYSGPLTLVDTTSPAWSTLFAGGGSLGSGPPCSYSSASGGMVTCQQPSVTLGPGQSATMFFGVYFGPSGYSGSFKNCVSLQGISDANSGNNTSCIGVSPAGPPPTPTASPALACVISSTGLTAWWRMNDPAGSTTLSEGMGAHPGTPQDSSGNPLPIGAGTGAPPWVGSVSGQVGNALFFDRSYGRIPHHPALNIGSNGMSVAGWLYTPPPSSATPSLQPILDKTYSVSPGCQILQGYALFLEWNAGANAYDLIFRLGNGVGSPGSSRVTATGAVLPNQPTFVAATVAWQPGNTAPVRLYVNGSQVQTGTISGVNATNVASPADLWLGGYQGPLPSSTCAGAPGEPVGPFFGNRLRLDEWELWSRVLSPAEVAALYNHEKAGNPKCSP